MRRGSSCEQVVYQKLDIKVINSDIPNDIIDKLFTGIRYNVNEKGCWIRGNDSTVYTTVSRNKKPVRAHRLSFELFNGRPLINLGCHTCDTPACINPEHIVDKSTRWNFQDAVSKGRLGQAFMGRKDKLPEKIGIDYYKESTPGFIERM